jgi:hypothetical protein
MFSVSNLDDEGIKSVSFQAIMTDRDDEIERLRRQLKAANEQIQSLQEISSHTPGHSRPNSYISIGSELSEIDELTQSGDEINKGEVGRCFVNMVD